MSCNKLTLSLQANHSLTTRKVIIIYLTLNEKTAHHCGYIKPGIYELSKKYSTFK